MPKETWTIAAGITVALLLGLLGFSLYDKKHQVDQASADLAQARTMVAKSDTEAAALRDTLSQTQARVAELQKEKDTALQSHKTLEDEMRAALESKDVTISQLQGKLTVNILDRVLFDSGEADLKPDGQEVLRKVAAVLAQHPTLKLHVIGHTDNVPIRAGAHARFATNWELSAGRALAAVRFLSEKAGVDPRRLGAIGYGEFRPVADNATAEGRAHNRRIEITILPEELAETLPASPLPHPAAVPVRLLNSTNAPAETSPTPLPPAPALSAEEK